MFVDLSCEVASVFKRLGELLVACYSPVEAFQAADGEIVFAETRGRDYVRTLSLPCGQCVGCRLERARQWAVRCMHEASLYERNCFVTLTYAEDHLPPGASLRYRDFQRFMRELRRAHPAARIRFFMAGEYGELTKRPHYHALLFNFDFEDKRIWRTTSAGHRLYTSAELEKLWPHGHSSIGEVSFDSASYVARYCLKKVTGQFSEAHYAGRVPEFARMSLRPGIAGPWLARFASDVSPDGRVVVNGRKARAPRYYDKALAVSHPDDAERLQYERVLASRARSADNTDARLKVREAVARGKLSLGGRGGL